MGKPWSPRINSARGDKRYRGLLSGYFHEPLLLGLGVASVAAMVFISRPMDVIDPGSLSVTPLCLLVPYLVNANHRIQAIIRVYEEPHAISLTVSPCGPGATDPTLGASSGVATREQAILTNTSSSQESLIQGARMKDMLRIFEDERRGRAPSWSNPCGIGRLFPPRRHPDCRQKTLSSDASAPAQWYGA
jgi:hypothetical protein